MIVLLPYDDLAKCAEVLDDKRLKRQRSDVLALLRRLDDSEEDHDHHAVKMWKGNELFLLKYGFILCTEWSGRGNNDETLERILPFQSEFPSESSKEPEWWGKEEFHDSHKSYLIRLHPTRYRKHWPLVSDDLPLIWPRSPNKGRKDKSVLDQERKVRQAHKAAEKAKAAMQDAYDAALDAGLHPRTLMPLTEDDNFEGMTAESVFIGTPDEELLEL